MYALGYESRVGKDTIADYLVTKGFVKLTFAEPLHNSINEFKRCINDTTDAKYRNVMIAMAGEAKRLFSDKIFVNIIEDKIKNLLSDGCNIIISDLREVQQLEMLSNYGFKYVRVIKSDRDTNNPSLENELKNVTPDIIITNNGSLEELFKKVDDVLLNVSE